MTAEDATAGRAALTSGGSFWRTTPTNEGAAITLTDGPHGVRAQTGAADHLGIAPSEPATCFPPAVGLAQSWDRDLVERVGETLGREARALQVGVLLGPGVNIKRDPRCGRNFEYFSEDPLLSGELGAAWVRGVQSCGVGTSVKHFAANNAETDRMRASSDVDERALREIYLRPFERIVRRARPWTVMCAYNRINGVYASENRWLLTDVLRGEWGFDGAVVSDWGAVRDRVAAIAAGVDLTMPGPSDGGDTAVADAVRAGALSERALQDAAVNVERLVARGTATAPDVSDTGTEAAHHALAREAAGRSIALLANGGDAPVLPLGTTESVAVLGRFAEYPRYQGGGSSHVTATRVDVPLEEIRKASGGTVTYVPGFPAPRETAHADRANAATDTDATTDTDGAAEAGALRAEAVAAAREADAAVLLLGLDETQESEGFDRTDIALPAEQLELARAVVAVQPRAVAVLSHGGVVALAELANIVPAVLDGGLLGQAGGGAIADVLFGHVNPSGRLAETVPMRLEDAPSYGNFPGEHGRILYGESVFVGYRGYDAYARAVCFPFGHGLSYTRFDYSDLRVQSGPDGIGVRVRITNTGTRDGREVVQCYVGCRDSAVRRPPRVLGGFRVVDVPVGGSVEVDVFIERDDLAYWDTRVPARIVEGGSYVVSVGASSRDLRLHAEVGVDGDVVTVPLTAESTVGEVLADPAGAEAFGALAERMAGSLGGDDGSAALGMDLTAMIAAMPLSHLPAVSGGALDAASVDALVERVNAARGV